MFGTPKVISTPLKNTQPEPIETLLNIFLVLRPRYVATSHNHSLVCCPFSPREHGSRVPEEQVSAPRWRWWWPWRRPWLLRWRWGPAAAASQQVLRAFALEKQEGDVGLQAKTASTLARGSLLSAQVHQEEQVRRGQAGVHVLSRQGRPRVLRRPRAGRRHVGQVEGKASSDSSVGCYCCCCCCSRA